MGLNPGLAPLSARPPTPPKESSTKLINGIESSNFSNLANRPALDSPDESPSSSAEYFRASAEKSQKKVGFSPWMQYHRLSTDGSIDWDSDGSTRRQPPSKECKSLKSILKACKDNTTFDSGNESMASDEASLAAMLRATTQHLASASRASRVDAYVTLFGCLSAYDDISDKPDEFQQVIEITGYIRRDVAARIDSDGPLDTQLVTQALKVLTVFICTPGIAAMLPEDFCSFILERALSSIEDADSPKILVSHFMHLLEKQKFSPKIMTSERVNRLITALDVVTSRFKSNRIICHRLMIYQRLLTQARSVMATRVESWMDYLISGMLSAIKDIRVRAIGFGLEASLRLGTSSSVSQSCIDLFNRASPEGVPVVEFLSSRLIEMVGSKEDGVHVPQIWSIVILFFRSRRRQLECWEHLKAWLVVIQRCLNSSDPQVKFQANIAWGRLIFSTNIGISTSASMAKMLRQPLVSQLERKATDKPSKQGKQVARSTYCTLLYYAFRPTAIPAQLDLFWDLYIAQILPSSFITSKSDVDHACEIFAALVSPNPKSKSWNENRANGSGLVKADELPGIDPKWIRSRAANMIKIYESFLDLGDWRTNDEQDTPLLLAWRSLMAAFGAASSKEVKVSMDTMNTISCIVNLLKRVLEKRGRQSNIQGNRNQVSDGVESGEPYDKFRCLIQEAVAKIGSIPFLERRLVLTSKNSFEAAETPSSRLTKDSGSLNSSAAHLLKILLVPGECNRSLTAYASTVKFVMHISLRSANSRQAHFGALRNMSRLLSADCVIDSQASLVFWRLLAEVTCSSLKCPPQSDPHNPVVYYPGRDYEEAVKILELGIQLATIEIVPHWLELYGCVTSVLQGNIGDDAVLLLITEQLAGAVQSRSNDCNEALLTAAVTLRNGASWPKSHKSMERTQRILWGHTSTTRYMKYEFPLENLFSMFNVLLGSVYESSATLPAQSIQTLLSSVRQWISTCPAEWQEYMLQRVQQGLAPWIHDSDKRISPTDSSLLQVDELWTAVVAGVERLPGHDSRLLRSIQPLLVSGFRSRHKTIANTTIGMWNRTFGCSELLEYPDDLHKTLIKLRLITEIRLPGLPDLPEAEFDKVNLNDHSDSNAYVDISQVMSSPIRFADSQEHDTEASHLPPTNLSGQDERHAPLRNPLGTLLHSPIPRIGKGRPMEVRREAKTTPKARLRHDDSQIQFAAIDSSPIASEPAESQNLTDRQKDVKERQGIQAAMFPEIRSSPKSATRHAEYTLPKLVYRPDQGPAKQTTMGDQISPIYPPDILANAFLSSSPTPASSKKDSRVTNFRDDPPSSPPSLSFNSKTNHEGIAFQAPIIQAEPLVRHQSHEPVDVEEGQSSTMLAGPSDGKDRNTVSEVPHSSDVKKGIPQSVATDSEANGRIMSDSEVFVDAPSGPVETNIGTAAADQIDMVPNSFESDNASQCLSEVDQINAQLLGEMERASSQQSSKQDQTQKSAPSDREKRRTKRKGSFHNSTGIQKKPKVASPSSDPQHVLESPQVAECVLIKVRQVEDPVTQSPVRVKRERSQSPSLIADTPIEGEARAKRQKLGRRKEKSPGGQLSQGSLSVSGSPHQIPGSHVDHLPVSSPAHTAARKSARLNRTLMDSPQNPASPSIEDPIAEPGSVTKSGKRRASKRWFWSKEGSQDEENQISTNADVASTDMEDAEVTMDRNRSEPAQQLPGEVASTGAESHPQDNHARMTEQGEHTTPRNETVDDDGSSTPVTTAGILQGFRRMLHNIKRVALGREEEREMVGVLFETMKEVHEAGRRHSAM